MAFNWGMATANLLGEDAHQVGEYTTRQNELEDRKIREATDLRKEKAKLARQMALAHFGYEQRDLYSKSFWDPSEKRLVNNLEVSKMSPEQRKNLLSLDEYNLQRKEKGAESMSALDAKLISSPQQVHKRGLLADESFANTERLLQAKRESALGLQTIKDKKKADRLGLSLSDYLKKKAEKDFYGKTGLSESQRLSAIMKIRNDYDNDFTNNALGDKKLSFNVWAKEKRPDAYQALWGGSKKKADVGALIKALLGTEPKKANPGGSSSGGVAPSNSSDNSPGRLPRGKASIGSKMLPDTKTIKKLLSTNVNGAALLGSIAGKSVNGMVEVVKRSPQWAEIVNQYAAKTNKTIGQSIIDFVKWAYSNNQSKQPVMRKF